MVELEGQGAEQIYASLLKSLHDGGFDNAYLTNNLIAFCSDGASVILGRNSGVNTRLKNDYSNIILLALLKSSFATYFGRLCQ